MNDDESNQGRGGKQICDPLGCAIRNVEYSISVERDLQCSSNPVAWPNKMSDIENIKQKSYFWHFFTSTSQNLQLNLLNL